MKAFAFSDLNSATAFRNVATSDWSAVSYKLHRFTVVTVRLIYVKSFKIPHQRGLVPSAKKHNLM